MQQIFTEQLGLEIINQWREKTGPVLPILLEVKQRFLDVPDEAIDLVAKELNLSRAEVVGVLSFYEDLHRDTNKPKQLKVCTSEACQAVGCRGLVEQLENHFATKINQGDLADMSFESVYCLGNCALGPSVMVDDKVYGRANLDKIKNLIAE